MFDIRSVLLKATCIASGLLCALSGFAENKPLGTWTAHLPLQSATSVCQSKDYVYAACQNGVLGINISNNFMERYTKVDGLSEVFTSQVGYDTATSTLVIAYQNANIDLIKNGKITRLPYLKNAIISGDKSVYAIYCTNGFAYLGTGLGVLKINLTKQEIADTYPFTEGANSYRVNGVYADDNAIYCATTKGVLKGIISPAVNLINFNNWTLYTNGIPAAEASAITAYQGKLTAAVGNSIYQLDGGSWTVLFSESNWKTLHLNNSNGKLLVAQQKDVSGNITDKRLGIWNGSSFTFYGNQFAIERPMQVLQDRLGNLWHADLFRGAVQQQGGSFTALYPNAPFAITSKEMGFLDGELWVTSSSIGSSANPNFNKNGIYHYKEQNWENLTIYNTPQLDSFYDISVAQPIPADNSMLFGSQTGILEYKVASGTFTINKFRPNATNPSERIFRITGADIDIDGNVWMSDTYSNVPIVCRKADGSYVYFNSGFLNGNLVKDILVDDYNQIWVAKENVNGGLTVLNYGPDIDDKSDDQYFNIAAGSGLGNLPVNNVICMVKDNDGVIWLGTGKGIATIPCAGYVTDYACEAEQICVDRKDGSGFCDYLLEDEIITCIAVDAANRKWIGTNNGIFLISADGQETVHYFNEDNSPLLSNVIRGITIEPASGEVFIGTDKGLCAFRSDATLTGSDTPEPFVYPNPVRPDYSGPIAFKGIPNNCNVKIVDVSGNLVYETTANGGQATWDGLLLNGERAATGVYYALCKGEGKKDKAKLKFVFIK